MSARSLKTKPATHGILSMAQRSFDTITCGDGGAAVIDSRTGHAITDSMRLKDAQEAAETLNNAASFGVRTLSRALASI